MQSVEQKILLRFPEPYIQLWGRMLEFSEIIEKYSTPLKNQKFWPLLGLAKKAALTTKSIAVLASAHFWADALVLGRTLFDLDVIVSWILETDTENRVEIFKGSINEDKLRLARKMAAGMSVAAQVMKDISDPTEFDIDELKKKVQALNKTGNIREMSREVDLERVYDLFYWVSSAFAHSSFISLIDYNEEERAKEKALAMFFGQSNSGFPCWIVLMGTPSTWIRIFESINTALELGFDEKLSEIHSMIGSTFTGIAGVQLSSSIPKGDMIVETCNELGKSQKQYSPNRIKKKK